LTASFTWQDGERTIAFGRGTAERAVELLGGPGYALLTTARAAAAAPAVAAAASSTHAVARGHVDELAAALLDDVAAALALGTGAAPTSPPSSSPGLPPTTSSPSSPGAPADTPASPPGSSPATPPSSPGLPPTSSPPRDRIVALGGGRVIDVAKSVAAAIAVTRGGPVPRVMAIPTTLSGAEMTPGHRHARGIDPSAPKVRPAVVVCDPRLAASQEESQLIASALNALGHAVEAPATTRANPVATLAAHDGARRIVAALARPGRPDRDELALGALLAGYAIGAAGLGLHHVLAQTLVRLAGAGHGAANAVLLPHTIGALAWRRPAEHDALAAALGEDPSAAAARLAARAGASSLTDLGVDASSLPACADAAAGRAELDLTPPRAERPEILGLYEQAL
jgi:hypothetical protein